MRIEPETFGPPKRAQAIRNSAPVPRDTVTLSHDQSGDDPTPKRKNVGAGLSGKLFAGIGLGVVALGLGGCTGGTNVPTPPNNEQPQHSNATSLTQRLEELRNGKDRTAYTSMAEAGYYQTLFRAIAKDQSPSAQPAAELAQKASQDFNFKGNPAEQQRQSREALEAIAKLDPGNDPVAGRYIEAAKAAMRVGDAFREASVNASGGLTTQLKVNGYEMAFQKAIEQLRLAPEKVQASSGMDPATVRNYSESLILSVQTAMDYSKELKDPALSAVLYQTTGDDVYGRVKTDGQFLGSQVRTALELIQKIQQQFGS